MAITVGFPGRKYILWPFKEMLKIRDRVPLSAFYVKFRIYAPQLCKQWSESVAGSGKQEIYEGQVYDMVLGRSKAANRIGRR